MVKSKLWIILLIASSAMAQNPQLDSIQAAVVEQLGLASSSGTARAINRAYVQVCTDYPALEKVDTVSIDSATGMTTIPTDCDRIAAVNLILEGGVLKLLKSLVGLPPDSLFERIGEEVEGTTDGTKQDFYNIKDRELYTYPRWQGPDSLVFEVTYYAIGAELDSATDSIQTDPAYYNAVFWYACAEIQMKRYNYESALHYLKMTWAMYGPPKGGAPQ